MSNQRVGKILRISGPVVEADDMLGSTMYEVCKVGEAGLIGEIIKIQGDICTIQVYEETVGVYPNEKVVATGAPLSVELAPGLIGQIFDGIQRPLPLILEETKDDFIRRGVVVPPLNYDKKWPFAPAIKKGAAVSAGDIIGSVVESPVVEHKVMIPPGVKGKITDIVKAGDYTILEPIVKVKSDGQEIELPMLQKWPVRFGRPIKERLEPTIPLLTGQRVFDTFFPIAKGGTSAIPGGFGTGKCIDGETLVLLSSGELCPIRELYNRFSNSFEKVVLDNEDETLIEFDEPLEIFSFDRDAGRITTKNATHIYRGYSDSMILLTTRKGRKIKLTPAHKLQVFNGEEVEERVSKDLKVGEYLLCPRKIAMDFSSNYHQRISIYDFSGTLRTSDELVKEKIIKAIDLLRQEQELTLKEIAEQLRVSYEVLIEIYHKRNNPSLQFIKRLISLTGIEIPVRTIKSERRSFDVTLPDRMSAELAEFLGLLLSDGNIKGNNGVYFYNNDLALRMRFQELVKSLFSLESKECFENTVDAIRFFSRPVVLFLEYLGVPTSKKSRTVSIPKELLLSNEEELVHFLNAYIASDGFVSGFTLEITTASSKMISCLSYLLSRLGVIYRLSQKTIKGHVYHRISVEGSQAEELSQLLKSYNVTVFPKTAKLYEYCNNVTSHFESSNAIPISSLLLLKQRDSLRALPQSREREKSLAAIKNVKAGQKITRKTLLKLVEQIRVNVTSDAPHLEDLSKLEYLLKLHEEFYFDEIKSIELISEPQEVFDLTVEDLQNFIGGEAPLILHNTVAQHQLAKWSDARIVVYIGCGERGNEMTNVLEDFPELIDPNTGEPLMNRTILIANTSNMPVAAREASVYTGITLAEFYRDMGYDIALMADSTSRWAEAMREISGRLEEMPGEAGYPAYLASKIAQFYERAGRVSLLASDERQGSITVTGAVSPPGGDFSEPVTQNTLRITKVFWALSKELMARRHFPAIDYLVSYTLYTNELDTWFAENVDSEFMNYRGEAMALLQKDKELEDIVQLVGPDALPETEKIVLEAARMIKEDFLQQNAFSEVDSYSTLEKQWHMLQIIIDFYYRMRELYNQGVTLTEMMQLPVIDRIARMKYVPNDKVSIELGGLLTDIHSLQADAITDRVKGKMLPGLKED